MVSSLFCWHHVRRNSDNYSSSQVFFEKPCMLEKVQVRLHPSCPPTPFPTPIITTHPTDIIMRYLVYVYIFNQTFRLGHWSSVVPSQWQMMCTQTRYPSSPGDCFDVKTPSFPYVSNIRSLATVIYIYTYIYIYIYTYFELNVFYIATVSFNAVDNMHGWPSSIPLCITCSYKSMVNSLNQTMCWRNVTF